MNIGIFFRVRNRLSTALQGFFFPFFFSRFGRGSRVLRPRRIEGSSRIELGCNVFINNDAWLETIKAFDDIPRLIVDDNVYIGNSSHIIATRSIHIEKDVLIADRVYIADYIHGYRDISLPIMKQQLEPRSKVRIGQGSWLGEGVAVIGASIGRNCVVGANSVVTKDVPDYSIVGGVPARVLKRYSFEIGDWVLEE